MNNLKSTRPEVANHGAFLEINEIYKKVVFFDCVGGDGIIPCGSVDCGAGRLVKRLDLTL